MDKSKQFFRILIKLTVLAMELCFLVSYLENRSVQSDKTEEQDHSSIRVAINTENFQGLLHKKVEITSNTAFQMTYFDSGHKEHILLFQADEICSVERDDERLGFGELQFSCKGDEGKLKLLSINRQQGKPSYYGSLILGKQEEGISIVNEVLLEQYLCGVLPSEMPAEYPMEALKAQAVCARTYACYWKERKRTGEKGAFLEKIGASIDDSVSFQVYNNLAEDERTNQAVRETKGLILCDQDTEALADIMYYSTSCGYDRKEDHLIAFQKYIMEFNEADAECMQPWYRWTYAVCRLDTDELYRRLVRKQKEKSSQVLIKSENGFFEEKELEHMESIREIQCSKRGSNGVAQTLELRTERQIIQVSGENAIRYVLCQPDTKVTLQNESTRVLEELLPSAFFQIITDKTGMDVVGYTVFGGGYGHGNGMSQNGAKAMGQQGSSYQEILSKYYPEYAIRDEKKLITGR